MAGLIPENGTVYEQDGDIYIYFNSDVHVRLYNDGDVLEAVQAWYKQENANYIGNVRELFRLLNKRLKEI